MSTTNTFAGWETLPPLPSPNGGFACGSVGGRIVVLGGTNWKDNTKRWLDAIWLLDPKSLEWSPQGRLPHPLAYAVTAAWKGDLLIAGGTDGTQPRKEVWRMRSSLKLERCGELSGPAVLAAGGVMGESLFVFGGCADPARLDGLHQGGERLHLGTGNLSPLALPGDVAFGLAASVAVEMELYVFGGARHDSLKAFVSMNAAWAFKADKGAWRSLQPYPLVLHGSAAVVLDKHRILIAGGYGGDPRDFSTAAFVYDTRRDSYSKTKDLPTAGIVGLVRAGDFVYCLAGEDRSPQHRTAACARAKVADLLRAASKE